MLEMERCWLIFAAAVASIAAVSADLPSYTGPRPLLHGPSHAQLGARSGPSADHLQVPPTDGGVRQRHLLRMIQRRSDGVRAASLGGPNSSPRPSTSATPSPQPRTSSGAPAAAPDGGFPQEPSQVAAQPRASATLATASDAQSSPSPSQQNTFEHALALLTAEPPGNNGAPFKNPAEAKAILEGKVEYISEAGELGPALAGQD